MPESAIKRILVADPEPEVRQKLKDVLSTIGYRVDTVENSQDVLNKTTTHDYSVALVDCQLSNNSGFDVLIELSASYPKTSVIMLSAEPSLQTVISSLRKGAYDFVVKPLDLTELTEIVHKAVDRYELLKLYQAMFTLGRQDRDIDNLRGTTSQRLPDKCSVSPL